MTWREIDPEKLMTLHSPLIIDVRSPCEYKAERIPEAINVPLLNNEERAIVGTLYANEGEIAARRLALRMISPKIPQIVDQILQYKQQERSLVIHCWRGGLRSEAVVSFLTIVGVDCWRLTGGYKRWRKYVLSRFDSFGSETTGIVLQGRTGSGKTELLQKLAADRENVIDLEGLANHRGSLFGSLGLESQPTQKNFEGELFNRLKRLSGNFFFVEAESRKIGKTAVPDFMLKLIQQGVRVLVTSSLERRVDRILSSYVIDGEDLVVDGVTKILEHAEIVERLGKKQIQHLHKLLTDRSAREFVSELLQNYYDPLYDRHIQAGEPYKLIIDSDDLQEALKQLKALKQAESNRCCK